jgi:hypothetical protein
MICISLSSFCCADLNGEHLRRDLRAGRIRGRIGRRLWRRIAQRTRRACHKLQCQLRVQLLYRPLTVVHICLHATLINLYIVTNTTFLHPHT